MEEPPERDAQDGATPARIDDDAIFKAWVSAQALNDGREAAIVKRMNGGGEDFEDDVELDAEPQQLTMTPREYQYELFEKAKAFNSIVVLDTGTGKTLIAIMLLRHTVEQELERSATQKKRRVAFFIVDKVALCMQQYRVICANLPFSVARISGDTQPAQAEQEYWSKLFDEHQIVVCTAQVLLDCLDYGFITFEQINLLIFDEAHHAKKDHPYASIMKRHYPRDQATRPRVLGLTASPVDTKSHNLEFAAEQLENLLCSKIVTVPDTLIAACSSERSHSERVEYYSVVQYDPTPSTVLTKQIAAATTGLDLIRRPLRQAEELGSTLGSWCGDRFWHVLMTESAMKSMALQAGRVEKSCFDYIEFESSEKLLKTLQPLISSCQVTSDPLSSGATSPKLSALRDILWHEFKTKNKTKCIIFVDQQITAIILTEFFRQDEVAPPGMVGDFMIGTGRTSTATSFTHYDRMAKLEDFRCGKTNCLFATSVAEEGLDIPACDLIIRFDMCKTAIQYIQSRGRARKSGSAYITMMEKNNYEHSQLHAKVTQGAQSMRMFCQNLPEDRKIGGYYISTEVEMIVADTAILSHRNSMVVLAKFVSSLAQSGAQSTGPDYITSAVGSKFVAWVILPDGCPFTSATGGAQRNKIRAKSAAAYEACLNLIQMRYINEHLQPVFKKLLPKMRNARLAIKSAKLTEYLKITKPKLWTQIPDIAPTRLFCAKIALGTASSGQSSILLLTRNPLPDIGATKLFMDDQVSVVSTLLHSGGSCAISATQLSQLTAFTLQVFKEVFSKHFEATAEELPFYFAVSKTDADGGDACQVDWAAFQYILAHGNTCMQPQNIDIYTNCFAYDAWDGSRKFLTTSMNHSYRPNDPAPSTTPAHKCRGYLSGEKTIAQYSCSARLQKRLEMHFEICQPVYNALLLSLRRDFLSLNDQNLKPDQPCLITLQHLVISTIPAHTIRALLLIPSLLARIDSVLVSLEACDLLGLRLHPRLAVEAFTKDATGAGSENVANDCLTVRNYERLEFLGDTFLKMATTIAIYTQNPSGTEFEQHVERMVLVCNKNLFKSALKWGLPAYIRSKNFDRRTWYPDLRLVHGKPSKSTNLHSLGDKTVADVCEAVIGAAYMSAEDGNMDEAVKAVTLFVDNDVHAMKSFSEYVLGFSTPSWQLSSSSAGVRATIGRVECLIGYGFQSALLLRSAFTHASYTVENIPNYQTLEFLGDALLDMAVVDYLYRKYPSAPPQWLTEHKMVVCSNHFLGCLCIHLGLQKEVLTTDAQVPAQINSFADRLELMKIQENAERKKRGLPTTRNYWVMATRPPKLLADVVEALIGAMFVDSGYNYSVVQNFFQQFVQPWLDDFIDHDVSGPGRCISQVAHLLQNKFHCRRWRFRVAEVPCESATGTKALTASDCVAALLVHGKVMWHAKADSGFEAKSKAAQIALEELRAWNQEIFNKKIECSCGSE